MAQPHFGLCQEAHHHYPNPDYLRRFFPSFTEVDTDERRAPSDSTFSEESIMECSRDYRYFLGTYVWIIIVVISAIPALVTFPTIEPGIIHSSSH
jgi:hypothetical protein